MAFCSNCGKGLEEDASFCSKCGKAVSGLEDTDGTFFSKTGTGEDFQIKRCPSCGYGIPSFVAFCPACGNEFRSAKISETLEHLISQVDDCEKEIEKNPQKYSTGYMSWSSSEKFFWILFNMLLFMIPLCIYFIWPMFLVKREPKLSLEEKRLANLIQNFPIPNDRESVLETLVFAKEKIDFISKERMNRKNFYWTRLWIQKAEQLEQKAELLFPGDEVVKKTYQEIIRDKKSVNLKIVKKAILGSFLLVIISLAVVGQIYNVNRTIEEDKKLRIPDTELGRLLPELGEVEGNVRLSSSEYLTIECPKFDFSAYEAYKEKCMEKGFFIDPEVSSISYEAYNSEGYKLRISCYDNRLRVTVNAKMEMQKIVWPSTKLAKLLPAPKSDFGKISYSTNEYFTVYIGKTTMEDFNTYMNACVELGFTEEMALYDKSYSALNRDGIKLSIRYQGYDIMYIDIREKK